MRIGDGCVAGLFELAPRVQAFRDLRAGQQHSTRLCGPRPASPERYRFNCARAKRLFRTPWERQQRPLELLQQEVGVLDSEGERGSNLEDLAVAARDPEQNTAVAHGVRNAPGLSSGARSALLRSTELDPDEKSRTAHLDDHRM